MGKKAKIKMKLFFLGGGGGNGVNWSHDLVGLCCTADLKRTGNETYKQMKTGSRQSSRL